MVTLGVCLETVFTDLPPQERIAGIADAGFRCVEFWHPEATWDGRTLREDLRKDPVKLRQACRQSGVTLNDFAFHAWDGSYGGCPVRPSHREIYLEQIRRMIAFAKEAGCSKGITLSGVVDPKLSRAEMRRSLEEALSAASAIAERESFTLLLEPLNTLVDHPGYYLDSWEEAVDIVRTIDSPHLKLLFDAYHMQIMRGNLLAAIEASLDRIGHFHAAGVPGRAEIFQGEVSYRGILRRLESLGYEGSFGLEYFPAIPDHSESLRRTFAYLKGE